jgi:hypothetical protein
MNNKEIVLDRYANKAVNLMKVEIKARHFSSGQLYNSIGYELTSKGVVFTGKLYGDALQYGRKRAFIPIKPLIAWIIRKNIQFKNTALTAKEARSAISKNPKKAVRGSLALRNATSMAFAILRAAKTGMKGKNNMQSLTGYYTKGIKDPYVQPAINKTFKTKAFEKDFRTACKEDIKIMLKNNK